ncbi:MAG: bifunctional phosphoribosylaminoimidazolecarboxamide formyltransferase/IMP cyclohydrolase [Verrucomicrobia bacterium]|nr:bifunctional phosphoribosylaminoimidazolecarboxamide formyltransferase/IMP cyclohydrolase [Verrucomicrobiota bacterium]MDA1065760.1 bifunctional phosphoribosylaminoimidazolecarboxamide formyltransferase/IMP cyclohydrolase [Verrucomicrobiota bacterium]
MSKLALLSVFDKTGLVDFARVLSEKHGYTILSTGGSAKTLRAANIEVTDVSEYTGFPEMMEGRVKTLHPKVHGGLLCRRDKPDHLAEAEKNGVSMIDLVAVNLYPFEQVTANPNCSYEDAIENIDIGGPSMLRSSAKNHASVTVVCEPEDYSRVLESLTSEDEDAKLDLRKQLALKVYRRTSEYDKAISDYLALQQVEPDMESISGYPKNWELSLPKVSNLRYGENPHQQAALYGNFFDVYDQLQGKELSYNNILDITAATYLIGEFEEATVAILKHTNPCGVASARTIMEAWHRAFETDKLATFGGIIVANRTVDEELALAIKEIFCEVVIAPRFTDEALAQFAKRKNVRLMVAKDGVGAEALREIRSVVGGLLVQDKDMKKANPMEYRVVTEREPTENEWASLLFGWRVVKHVKSNAIVYAGNKRTLGVGAGQMARVDSSQVAVWKSKEAGLDLQGSIVASDAFFPFADGLLAAADAGATAAIQPGGSVRDNEVIAAANERGMAMVFTGVRHFRH